MAEFNLIAGMRAKAATAYAPALTYLAAGAAAVTRGCLERRQELAFAFELHRAECELWTGALPSVEERLAVLAARAVDTVQRCGRRKPPCGSVHDARGQRPLCRGGPGMPSACGHRLGGASLPSWKRVASTSGSGPSSEAARSRTSSTCRVMQDPRVSATLDVLTALGPPTLYTDGNLYALTSCRAINLSLERGNSDAAPAHYASVGLMAGDRFGDYDAGYRLAKMGCDLTERRGLKRFEARPMRCSCSLSRGPVPVTHVINPARRAFDMANEQGDPTYAAYACWDLTSVSLLAAGDPLEQVEREFEHGLEFARTLRFGFVADMISAPLALARTPLVARPQNSACSTLAGSRSARSRSA